MKFGQVADAVTTDPITVLENAPEAGLAQEFVDLVTGETGQDFLGQAGFGRP